MSQTTYSGTKVGDYHVLAEVGSGGMGRVLKAFDEKLERTVALKFLAEEGEAPAREAAALLREARAASVLDHKNIVAIHAIEHTDDGRPFLVMAYCEGESLATRVHRGPLSIPEAVDIAEQVGEGLAHAHGHNIVHRDIKASNIILTADGTAKIVDFGLARHVSADASTQTLRFAGTLSYMAPEQLASGAVDARTDIWSLGVLLYEMLTGRLPFERETPVAGVAAIARAAPTPMPEIPRELQVIVYRALAKQPQDRYQSAAEFVHDLRALGSERHADVTAEIEYRTGLATRAPAPPRRGMSTRAMFAWSALGVFVVLWVTLVPALLRWSRQVPGFSPPATTAAHASYLRGVALLDRYDQPGNLDAAVKEFQATVQADPKFALAYAGLCETYWVKYKMDENLRWVDQATAHCQRAAELNDRLPGLYVALGRIHNGTGKRDLALQELQRALELDRNNAAAWLAMADTYAGLQRKEEAEAAYQHAIALRPEQWNGYYRLASFYYAETRYAEAAEQFRKVLAIAPDSELTHSGLGVTLLNLKQDAAAEQELRTAITMTPDYAATANLAFLYYRQRRFAESAAMNEKALQIDDQDYRVWDNLGNAYLWLDRAADAQRAYERERALLQKLLPLKPDDGLVRADLALTSARLLQRKEALTQVEAATALAPDLPSVQVRAGETYELLGDRKRALSFLRKALAAGYEPERLRLDPSLRGLLAAPAGGHLFAGTHPAALPK